MQAPGIILLLMLALSIWPSGARADDGLPVSSAERAVRALERQWLDAYEKRDTVAMHRIVADDFMITFPDGSTQDKARIMAMIRSPLTGPPTTRFRTEGVRARIYGKTVILTGIVVTEWQRDGQPMSDRSTYTDTYAERNGRWQVVASHLSQAPGAKPAANDTTGGAKE